MAYPGAPPPYSHTPSDPGLIVNPNVPYEGPLSQLCDGFMITINGRVFPKANSFYVNLAIRNPHRDIAYHVNPRFQERQVVRNTKLGRSWGKEERGGGAFPLQADQNFELIILVTDSSYRTAFNGNHFCEFVHRIPKERVDHLAIAGDVMINQIKITDPRIPVAYAPPTGAYVSVSYPTGSQSYPGPGAPQGYPQPSQHYPGAASEPKVAVHIHHPAAGHPASSPAPANPGLSKPKTPTKPTIALPHLQPLPNGAVPGTLIRMQGTPKICARRMRFDFLTADKQDIAFHIAPRFDEGVVVRNTRKEGAWGSEERQQSNFPFARGREFNMIIYVDPEKYQVTIDGENFITYKHRIQNLDRVRFVKVEGDLDLHSIQI